MIFFFSRLVSSRSSCIKLNLRFITQVSIASSTKSGIEQVDYIKSEIQKDGIDWKLIKDTVLSKRGTINTKNIDAVLLKIMINDNKLNASLSFADYIRKTNENLSLGAINGLLGLYYEIGKKTLTEDQKQFILDSYKYLYDEYKVLDFMTCERLLHSLCVIDEWEKALRVLDDIHASSVPSHSAYSMLIATLFKNNKKSEALKIIAKSLNNKRALQDNAYEEWINYILRKHKDKRTVLKYLEQICVHISINCVVVPMETAKKIRAIYSSLNWSAHITKIKKKNGQCVCCQEKLECLKLSEEEFSTLQNIVKEKVLVGSDLFLKTSPQELKKFTSFVEKTAPYDVVIDALNVAYAVGKGNFMDKANLLNAVVNHFAMQNRRILLIGRRHMINWAKRPMEEMLKKTCSFFTDNLSQDDPFFIVAALLSGSHTDIVSKDLLRGHRFLLKDEQLSHLFQRWQWQHQWMVFSSRQKGFVVQPPLPYTPCAQKKNDGWHLPFEANTTTATSLVNDGIPDLSSWLCLRPN